MRADLEHFVAELRERIPSGDADTIGSLLDDWDARSDGDASCAAVIDAIGHIAAERAPLVCRLKAIIALLGDGRSIRIPRELLRLPRRII